jgi:poly-gamma-glutamate capsule biosynthesis protein CapA/YwtB (metallophosphatase superfamily)
MRFMPGKHKRSIPIAITILFLLTNWAASQESPLLDLTGGVPVTTSSLSIEGDWVRLSLHGELSGDGIYLLFHGPELNFDLNVSTLLGATQRSFYVDPISLPLMEKSFYRVLEFPEGLNLVIDEIMIEDFEDGTVSLSSYPGQDEDPNAWEVTSISTYGSTLFSLMLYGNTWKIESIPPIALAAGTVWRAAVMVEDMGEFQAFGVGDGTNELFYVFDGTYLPIGDPWNTTFYGVVPLREWALLNMPIANDWMIRYGELPVIDRLFYVNDIDEGGETATSFFDEIHDITEDLPSTPQAFITAAGDSSQPQPYYQFTSTVIDPDSPTHTYFWDFGDSTFSGQPNPNHTYSSPGYRTVSLIVMDDDSLFGDAAVHLLPPPGTPDPEFTLNTAGDVMLARRYEEAGGIIPTYGVNYIFERTLSMFGQAADVNLINLECQLTDEGYPHPTKDYIFRSSPENVAGLQYAGFDYVALGNNHTMDYMEPGLMETMAVLDTAGILFSGSGMNEYWATRPAFFTVDGIRVAVLSYCNRDGREDFLPPFLEAAYNKPGFAMFDEPTLEATIPAVDSLADVIIVQAHVGTEYDYSPLDATPELAQLDPEEYLRFSDRIDSIDRYLEHRAIELGADVIFCHHPHVLRGFEVYQDKLIAHSFGNFAFDQNYWETYLSMILYCTVTLDGIEDFTFRPVYIDDYVPTPATGELAENIMRKLAALSEELDTDVVYDSTTGVGTIATGTAQVFETERQVSTTLNFREEGNYWVSEPLRIEDPGFLSAFVSLTGIPGGAGIDASLGREILLHGGFEYEGGWLWNINSEDVFLETMNPHSGTYCMGVRHSGGWYYHYTDLEDNIPTEAESRYTIDGYMAGSNCSAARFGVLFYSGRFSGNPVASEYTPAQDGTFPWTRFYLNVNSPDDGWYADVRCRNSAPQSGTGTAYFDDLALVDWTIGWMSISTGFTPIPYPSENTYLQLRVDESLSSAQLTYRMTERTIQ